MINGSRDMLSSFTEGLVTYACQDLEEESREELIYMAKLCEIAECYDELSISERNLLSVAYKQSVNPKRHSWTMTSSICSKLSEKNEIQQLKMAQLYQQRIEHEITEICNELFHLLDHYLIPTANRIQDGEAILFFFKMKGDYYRYLAFQSKLRGNNDDGELLKYYSQQALQAYETARTMSTTIPASDPLRLGFALNWSVFYHDIMDMPREAFNIAKEAFDETLNELDTLSEESYKDTAFIMQLLRDSLTLWDYDAEEEEDRVQKQDHH
nr:unnamed protein product [Naegleria fowleri]